MTNLLASGMGWLAGQLTEHASSAVVYTRGAASIGIAATIGRHKPQVVAGPGGADAAGVLYAFEMRLTFQRGALGSLDLPQRGDTVTFSAGGVTSVYEVLPIEGERWWRDSDAFGNRIEVLVKLAERTT